MALLAVPWKMPEVCRWTVGRVEDPKSQSDRIIESV